MTVIHVASSGSLKATRVKVQKELAPSTLIELKNSFLSYSVLRAAINTKNSSFIFHQQYSLLNLIFSYIISILFNKKNKFIYDIHDLLRPPEDKELKKNIFYHVSKVMEKLVFRLKGIKLLTVSKGLARELELESKREVFVFYSISNEKVDKDVLVEKLKKKDKGECGSAVYLGQVFPARIMPEDIISLKKINISTSIFGFFPWLDKLDYKSSILKEVRSSGGTYHGKFEPDEINFIENYDYSLLLFNEKSSNIRYCLPNKLFQSLRFGLICIVSPYLEEVRELFGDTGYIRIFEDITNKEKKCCPSLLIDKLYFLQKNNCIVFNSLVS